MTTLTEVEALGARIQAGIAASAGTPPMADLLKDCARTIINQQEELIRLRHELERERVL